VKKSLLYQVTKKQKVKSLLVTNKEADSAISGQPVTVQLDREVDVSRGCVLVKERKVENGGYVYSNYSLDG
jgi:sulfate adenylyltransferase subunit 1 (EFTu-like GTPase family)